MMIKMWQTEKTGKNAYSPQTFYTSSQDSRGNSIVYNVKVPSHYGSMLAQMKEDFPQIKTAADGFRDGFFHRYHWLYGNEEEVQMSSQHLMFTEVARAHAIESHIATMKELPILITKICDQAIQAGDMITLNDYLQSSYYSAASYNEPWKSRIIEILDRYAERAKMGF